MTRVLPRTNFNSSTFIRLLSDLAVLDTAAAKPAFAERLGQWVGVSDAITLYGALAPAGTTEPGMPAAVNARARLAAERELGRVKSSLMASINRSCAAESAESRLRFPVPLPDTAEETAAFYTAVHRFYAAHQRDMDAAVAPLRTRVRQALADASPALRQLSQLDAALDDILIARERRLLATVPVLLEKRFERLLAAHQQAVAKDGQADDASRWLEPGGWLAGFRDELKGVLQAELELRLQPVIGLIEAFSSEVH